MAFSNLKLTMTFECEIHRSLVQYLTEMKEEESRICIAEKMKMQLKAERSHFCAEWSRKAIQYGNLILLIDLL